MLPSDMADFVHFARGCVTSPLPMHVIGRLPTRSFGSEGVPNKTSCLGVCSKKRRKHGLRNVLGQSVPS